MRSFNCTSTWIHSSSVKLGHTWCGCVTVVLSGFRMTLVRSGFTCSARKMRIIRLKAVYDEIDLSQSSYKLNKTISGWVAFRIKSPNFSIFMQAWNGSANSEPLMTMLGKSSKCTSKGSNMPLRVTMICFGCSSTGRERIKAATSSAVFHFANCDKRFWPAHTDVWMIFRNNCPVRGLKMKIAPFTGFVVKLPSKVLWIVTRYTLVSSTNQMIWELKSSP
mmetsp:Transcript_122947/g.353172  ORF Transcript_122947/g.353172 Transcript_122947/m.353172 type:complete len:220 (-) Transcript_122947:2133-2792(-)